MIVSNPPYLTKKELENTSYEIKNYEPLIALDGGEDGLDLYREFSRKIYALMNIKSYLILEIGEKQFNNIIEISKEEMYNMNANIFSISENVIVSEKGFVRLNNELSKRGFTVETVPYAEIAKMEGLLRCSTMPLIRE